MVSELTKNKENNAKNGWFISFGPNNPRYIIQVTLTSLDDKQRESQVFLASLHPGRLTWNLKITGKIISTKPSFSGSMYMVGGLLLVNQPDP